MPNARNAIAENANAARPIPDQGVSNVKFKNSIQILAESMNNQHNQVHDLVNANGCSAAASVRDFVRMNHLEFLGSQTGEDTNNLLDDQEDI